MGLLKKATAYHDKAEMDMMNQAHAALLAAPTKPKHTHKLSRLMKVFTATALLSTAAAQPLQPSRLMKPFHQEKPLITAAYESNKADAAELYRVVYASQAYAKSRVSFQERIMLAKLLYGEAGHGTDPVEVIHTVLNRMSSPLFKGDMASIITQKNQYIGYNPNHPVVPGYLRLINFVVQEWEDHGCQPIEDCDRIYFVTGRKGYDNKFEISPDHQGVWIPHNKKQYAKHYCATASRQAKEFYAHNKIDRRETIPAQYFGKDIER